jgi:hypothetical protein
MSNHSHLLFELFNTSKNSIKKSCFSLSSLKNYTFNGVAKRAGHLVIQAEQFLAQTDTIGALYTVFYVVMMLFKADPHQQPLSLYSWFHLEYLRFQRRSLKMGCLDYEFQNVVTENPFCTSKIFLRSGILSCH